MKRELADASSTQRKGRVSGDWAHVTSMAAAHAQCFVLWLEDVGVTIRRGIWVGDSQPCQPHRKEVVNWH